MTKTLALIIVLATGYINNANASWQSYVDENLVGTGYVAKGAIVGLDGSTWASSASFLSEGEPAAIAGAFSLPVYPEEGSIIETGLYIEGQKYFAIQANEEFIYLKKGPLGAYLYKTNQAVVLGRYAEGTNPANCKSVVEDLAAYLIESQY